MNFDWKIIFAVLATITVVIGYVPYFKDIFKKQTKPHLYTWIIWAITQGTATAALLTGGGKLGAIGLITGTILVLIVCILSLKYGTKNITKSDTATLVAALLAIVVWWQLDQPLISVIVVAAIDGLGYIPTFRKTWVDPYSETIPFWIIMALSLVFIIISNAEYNLLTMTYLAVLLVCNISVALIATLRRKSVQNRDTTQEEIS